MHHSHPVFVVKQSVPATQRKPDLDPQYISGRILELLSTNVAELRQRFYNSAYISFFSQTGLPIHNVCLLEATHESMSIGDVHPLCEFGYYSKLYQKVPRELNSREFMIIEQYLDTTPADTNIWCHQIPSVLAPVIIITYGDKSSDKSGDKSYILSLPELKMNDNHLYVHFVQYLHHNAEVYLNLLLANIPKEKEEIIRIQCRAWSELINYSHLASIAASYM
jgi:hypothetical protein